MWSKGWAYLTIIVLLCATLLQPVSAAAIVKENSEEIKATEEVTINNEQTTLEKGMQEPPIDIGTSDIKTNENYAYEERDYIVPQTKTGAKVVYMLEGYKNSFYSTEWDGYRYFYNDLRAAGFDVYEKTYYELKQENINQYDVMIFNVNSVSSVTQEVATFIEQYILNGGSLFLMGDLTTNTFTGNERVNKVAERFGIEFYSGLMVDTSKNYNKNPLLPVTTNFVTPRSSITKNVNSFYLNWGAAIKATSKNVIPLAYSSNTSWLETNSSWNSWQNRWNYSKDSKDINGPFITLALSKYGLGHVVAIGDKGWLVNGSYDSLSHDILGLNIVQWLAEAVVKIEHSVSPIYPASNQVKSEVMKGGKAVRTYQLKTTEGDILREYQIAYRSNLSSEIKYTKTNEKGIFTIEIPAVLSTSNVTIEFTNLEAVKPISFMVEVEDLKYEQSFNYSINGKIGAGVSAGPGIQLGPVQGGANISAGIRGTNGATISLKSLTEGELYDLVIGLTADRSSSIYAETGAKLGFKDDFAEGLSLNGPTAGAEAGFVNAQTVSLKLKEFNNPDMSKEYLKAMLSVLYNIIEVAIMQDRNLANNKILELARDEIKSRLTSNAYSYELSNKTDITLGGATDLGFGIGAKIFQSEDDDFSLRMSLGSASIKTIQSYEIASSSLGQYNVKFGNTLETSSEDFAMATRVPIGTKGLGLIPSFKLSGDKAFTSGETTLDYNKNGLKSYQYELKTQSTDTKDFFTSTLSKESTKYKINQSNLRYFNSNEIVNNALNNKIELFRSPLEDAEKLVDFDEGTMQIERTGGYLKESKIPLELGLALGYKVELGITLSGKEDLTYTTEEGFMNPNLGYIPTARYDANEIPIEKHEVNDFLEDSLKMLDFILEDFLDVVEAKVNEVKEFISEKGKATVELSKNIWGVTKVGITKVKNIFSFTIQTESGEALMVSDLYVLSLQNEKSETISEVDQGFIPFSIEYTDKVLEELGLIDKEQYIALYHWNSEKSVYERIQANHDLEKNTVSTMLSKGGQYVLAYNEFNPVFSDFSYEEDDTKVNVRMKIQDSFEEININDLSIYANGQTVKLVKENYSVATGLLTFQVPIEDVEELIIDFKLNSKYGEFVHQEKIILTTEKALLTGVTAVDKGDLVSITATVTDVSKIDILEVYLDVNGEQKKYSLLPIGNNQYQFEFKKTPEVADIKYLVFATYKSGYIQYDQWRSMNLSDILALNVVGTTLNDGYIYFNEPIEIQFNRKIIAQNLNQIYVQSSTGESVAVLSTIINDKLRVTPVYKFNDNETYTVVIPEGAIKDVFNMSLKQPYSFDFIMHNQNTYRPSKEWTITFSKPVDFTSMSGAVTIVDKSTGEVITPNLTLLNDLQVKVAPPSQLTRDNSYQIVIESSVLSQTGEKLSKRVTKDVEIK